MPVTAADKQRLVLKEGILGQGRQLNGVFASKRICPHKKSAGAGHTCSSLASQLGLTNEPQVPERPSLKNIGTAPKEWHLRVTSGPHTFVGHVPEYTCTCMCTTCSKTHSHICICKTHMYTSIYTKASILLCLTLEDSKPESLCFKGMPLSRFEVSDGQISAPKAKQQMSRALLTT